jgi:hypothetical protein
MFSKIPAWFQIVSSCAAMTFAGLMITSASFVPPVA